MLDRASGFDSNRLILVSKKPDKMCQQVWFGQAAALHQRQSAGGAQGSGGVGAASPHRFELNVVHAAEEDGSVLMLERGQRAAEGILGPALRIRLDRIVKKSLESGK